MDSSQPAADRRQFFRRKKQVKVFVSDAEGVAAPFTAWVLDRSQGGLGLQVHKEIAPGTVLTVKPAGAPEGLAWIPIEVKSCRPFEGNFELGCQFLREPSYSVLLLFG